MADLPKDSIQSLLIHISSTHSEAMPVGAQTLLQSLIDCAPKAIETTSADSASFSKESVKTGNPGVSDDSLRKRFQFFNQFCETHHVGLTLKSRKHHFLLEIDPQQFDLVTTEKMVSLSKNIAEEHDEQPAVQPELRPEPPKPIVFISHKWHKNEALREIFHEFCAQLNEKLANPPKGRPTFKLFYSTSPYEGFKPDSDRQTQQDDWCQQAFLGLIFWSQLYDHSEACQCELNFFIDENGKNQPGKRAIVLLDYDQLDDMPERLKARNAFFYPADNEISLVEYWESATLTTKGKYIAALRDRIYEAFDSAVASSQSVEPLPSPPLIKGGSLNSGLKHKHGAGKPETLSNDAIEEHRLDYQLLKAGETQARDTLNDNATQQPEAYEERERIELIPVLSRWANDFGANSTRVSVLLGDFGFGKTVSCRLLNKTLSSAYQENPNEALLPLYLDLKALQADIAEHKSKPIEHLLEAMLQKTGNKLTVSGEDIIQYIRQNRCLVVFDGFDEIGHHLNEAEQQTVYASLLDIIPAEVYRNDAKRLLGKPDCMPDGSEFPSKLLISCRTHFFNKLSKEESFISGGTRHALGAQGAGVINVRRFYMAPFSAKTVEKYLCTVMDKEEGLRAKNMLGEIHDLSELSSHPIMLDLITRQLPQLQTRQQAGEAVNSAVLYLNLFEAIGERDTGKHKIRLSDKQELLAVLALHLWRKQQTSISIKHLDEWFANYGTQHRTIRHQLTTSTDAMQVLMQDLCNASLLVRDDDRYRFAHTSYLEFFIALGLFEAIRQHQDATCFDSLLDGAEATLNPETLQFLLNWWQVAEEEDREQFDQRFRQLLESDSTLNVRQLGFAVWRFAQLNQTQEPGESFPHSAKANWAGMNFHGEFIPEALRHLDYSNLNLRDCQFHLVRFNALRFNRADFSASQHTQTYFHHGELNQAQWGDTKINTDSFHSHLPTRIKYDHNKPKALKKLQRQTGHFAAVHSAAFSHDDQRIISASDDNTLKIWDANNAQCLHTLKGHQNWVRSAAFSHDDQRIISASDDNTLKIWDANNAQCLHTLKGHQGTVWSAAFSHDDQRIISASSDNTLKIWDANNAQCLHTLKGHQNWVRSAAFSHDDQRIISASSDNTLKIWDANNAQCLHTLKGHQGTVWSAAFSHDDQRIISASSDNTLKIWDANNAQCLHTLKGHQSIVLSAAFSHDDQRIISASSDNTLKIWDANNAQCLHTLKGHQGTVWSAAFSHDDQRIISASSDNTLKIWDANNAQCLHTLKGHQSIVLSAAFSHDDQRIISASSDNTLKIWDANNAQCLHTLKGHQSIVLSAAFSHDDQRIISASDDNTLKIWDANNAQCLHTLKGHQGTVWSAAFSHDDQRIISASSDNTLKIWDANNAQCLHTLKGHQNWVRSAAFSHDDQRIISASDDNTLKIWDANNAQCLHTLKGHQGTVWSAAFSHDDQRIISASSDNTLKIWDANNAQCLHTLKGHQNWVRSAAFSHDDQRIISASSDNTLKIWDANNAQCLHTLKGHQGTVWSAAFSHDDQRIISASDDNTLKIWDANSGELLMTVLSTGNGELVYQGNDESIVPTYIKGNAWEYCYGLDDEGNWVHPCQYEHWGEVYQP